METSLGRFFVCFFVRMILEKNYCNVVNPIMNHPQKSQFLWVGFQPSPNGRFIVGLPTLCVCVNCKVMGQNKPYFCVSNIRCQIEYVSFSTPGRMIPRCLLLAG